MNKINITFAAALMVLCGAGSLSAENVEVKVDLSTSRSIGAVEEFKRENYINMHGSPWHGFEPDEWAYLESLGVSFGRALMTPGEGSSVAAGAKVSDLERNGANWAKFFKQKYEGQTYGPDALEGMIVTNHPTRGDGEKPKPKYAFYWKGENADYTPEAEYSVAFFKSHFTNNGLRTPSYYEPMNEPYVHARDYRRFGATEEQVRSEMARYHKRLAEELHKNFSREELKVGGFASAWPYMEGFNSDFKHWNERMKAFIDYAGDEMDFYSIHVYDGKNVTGEETFRSGSNADALIDLIEGYCSIKFGERRPVVISEHGLTYPGMKGQPYSEQSNWAILRSVNHQTIQFIERGDNVETCVPFLTAKATWITGPNPYPWVTSRKDENGKWVWTHLIKYFELWRGVKGDFFDVTSSEVDVQTLALVDGRKAYIILNSFDDVDVDLSMVEIPGAKVVKCTKRSLFHDKNNVPVLSEKKFSLSKDKLSLGNGETVILEVKYNKPIKAANAMRRERFYASSYLKPIVKGETNSFDVAIEEGEMERATLKVAFARPLSASLCPVLMVNGKEYPFPRDWKGYDQSNRTKEGFFGSIDVELDVEDIKAENTISLRFDDTTAGTISTIAMCVDYRE